MSSEKGMAFIDGANINKGAESLNIKIDYYKLLNFIKDYLNNLEPDIHYTLVRPYYYSADDKDPKRQVFHEKLKSFGYEIRLLELVKFHEEATNKYIQKQKGVDIWLATEMLTFAFHNNYEIALLYSGDQDFLPVIKAVKDLAKKVIICSFEKSTSYKLKYEADKYCRLDDYLDDIKMIK